MKTTATETADAKEIDLVGRVTASVLLGGAGLIITTVLTVLLQH